MSSKPQIIIESDASVEVWGAYSQGQKAGRPCSKLERMKHINIVELKAVTFAILTFTKIFSQAKIIHLQMDNGNLGLSSSKYGHVYCRASTRNTQCGSRSSVLISNGFQ